VKNVRLVEETGTMANEKARSLRRNRTAAELLLWKELRKLKAQGYKFRQQAPIDHFIVDFVCLTERLIIEADGGTHSTSEELERDAERENYLKDQGFQIIRFWNDDIYKNIEGVMDSIIAALPPTPDPSPQGGGEKKGHGPN